MMVPRSHRVAVCDLGREGVVAKKRTSFYHPNGRDWVKVKNPRYWRRDAERGAMMRGSTSIGRALASSEAPTRKRRGPRSHQPVTRARMLSASHVSCGRVPRASLPSPYPVPMRASLVALRFYDGRGRAGCPVRRAHPSPQPPRRITSRGTPAASASAIAAHHRVSAALTEARRRLQRCREVMLPLREGHPVGHRQGPNTAPASGGTFTHPSSSHSSIRR